MSGWSKVTRAVKTSTVPRHIPNFQAGKVESQSWLPKIGPDTPTPAENPRSFRKMGCQKRGIAGSKREFTIFNLGGRLKCPRAYPANLSALYSVSITAYQSDPSDLCRNRENRVKTGFFWVGVLHDLATWRYDKSNINSLVEIWTPIHPHLDRDQIGFNNISIGFISASLPKPKKLVKNRSVPKRSVFDPVFFDPFS